MMYDFCCFWLVLFLLLLRERDATKESTTRTVLLEKKHPDVKVATVVDAHCSTPCRVSRDERSKHISFLSLFLCWKGVHKRRERDENG